MKETIGIIGSGAIGSGVARLAVEAGYNVVLSNSRGAETLSGLVAELGNNARAATPTEAAQTSDIIVVSVPLSAYGKLPAEALQGKIVIDTTNYYPVRDNNNFVLDSGELTTSELLQQYLKGAIIVKALHNQDAPHLYINASPNDKSKRTTLPIAGDNTEAKEKVTGFMNAIGYDTIDTGTLSDSWRIEPGMPIYIWPYAPAVPESMNIEEAKAFYKNTQGSPVSKNQAKELVDKAVRKTPIGGFPEDLPKTWIAIVSEAYSN
jgi:predicted dinucleotide-binding enzyme